jgi:hypothetical protein
VILSSNDWFPNNGGSIKYWTQKYLESVAIMLDRYSKDLARTCKETRGRRELYSTRATSPLRQYSPHKHLFPFIPYFIISTNVTKAISRIQKETKQQKKETSTCLKPSLLW